jgi:hypothetical protein
VYVMPQSTDRPRWRHSSSKVFSSSTVSRMHSSTKLGREMATCRYGGESGWMKSGS